MPTMILRLGANTLNDLRNVPHAAYYEVRAGTFQYGLVLCTCGLYLAQIDRKPQRQEEGARAILKPPTTKSRSRTFPRMHCIPPVRFRSVLTCQHGSSPRAGVLALLDVHARVSHLHARPSRANERDNYLYGVYAKCAAWPSVPPHCARMYFQPHGKTISEA